MIPKILSSCHPVGQPDSMTRSYLVTLLGSPWLQANEEARADWVLSLMLPKSVIAKLKSAGTDG